MTEPTRPTRAQIAADSAAMTRLAQAGRVAEERSRAAAAGQRTAEQPSTLETSREIQRLGISAKAWTEGFMAAGLHYIALVNGGPSPEPVNPYHAPLIAALETENEESHRA